LERIGALHLQAVSDISDPFFQNHADAVSEVCWAMARRFRRGARLLVCADTKSDADHVAVEFVHPVIVGKRALPARALSIEPASALGLLARPEDIALGIMTQTIGDEVIDALRVARSMGLLTIVLAGRGCAALAELSLDHRFVVPSADPFVVQEVHETLYHILWELVHVFFEHEPLP